MALALLLILLVLWLRCVVSDLCIDCGELVDDDGSKYGTVIGRRINLSGNPYFWFCYRCYFMVRVAFNGEPAPICQYCKQSDCVELEC